MNTNRDSSVYTKLRQAKINSAYNATMIGSVNSGKVTFPTGGISNKDASLKTDIVLGDSFCGNIDSSSITPVAPPSPAPTGVVQYAYFTTAGSTTWTAPATCQSPITYWIVGGGGGGGGAFDNAGAGGGGGGGARTGTYPVVAGTTYTLVVGEGGAGGTARGSSFPNPLITPGICTDGTAGTNSSFDSTNGGPVAAGGGEGLRRGNNTAAGGGYGGFLSIGGYGGDGGFGGGGGGGAGDVGTDGGALSAGTGGPGSSFIIPGYNGGNSQSYGIGGNGGANINTNLNFIVGADGLANTGKGGGGGGAGSFGPPIAGGLIKLGGDGGSGLVVIEFIA